MYIYNTNKISLIHTVVHSIQGKFDRWQFKLNIQKESPEHITDKASVLLSFLPILGRVQPWGRTLGALTMDIRAEVRLKLHNYESDN